MSDTPMTDAAKYEVVVGRESDGSSATESVVDSDVCRQIERELVESRAVVSKAKYDELFAIASLAIHHLEMVGTTACGCEDIARYRNIKKIIVAYEALKQSK